jgi:hypothetical protein
MRVSAGRRLATGYPSQRKLRRQMSCIRRIQDLCVAFKETCVSQVMRGYHQIDLVCVTELHVLFMQKIQP